MKVLNRAEYLSRCGIRRAPYEKVYPPKEVISAGENHNLEQD